MKMQVYKYGKVKFLQVENTARKYQEVTVIRLSCVLTLCTRQVIFVLLLLLLLVVVVVVVV